MSDLPPLAARISEQLQTELPGLRAQARMAPQGRIAPDYNPDPEGAKKAAILLGMTSEWELLMIRRAADQRSHSGQLAFPGGAWEPQDKDLSQTALREAHEEIGLSPYRSTILGRLTPLYIPVSNYAVHPFVAYVPVVGSLERQADEVDEILIVPIDELHSRRGKFTYRRPGSTVPHEAPCYYCEGGAVWGATAMIIEEFLTVYQAAIGAASL